MTEQSPECAPVVPRCQRCHDKPELALLTYLPHLGAEPAYRIFNCSICGFIEWIAQQAEA